MLGSGKPARGENPNTSIVIAQLVADRYRESRVAARYTYPLSSIGNVNASQQRSRMDRISSGSNVIAGQRFAANYHYTATGATDRDGRRAGEVVASLEI